MSMMSLNFDLSMNDDLWYENYHCLKQQLRYLKIERSNWILKQQQCKNKMEEYTTTSSIQNCIPLYQNEILNDNYQNLSRYYDIVSETIEHLNKQISAVQYDIQLTVQ